MFQMSLPSPRTRLTFVWEAQNYASLSQPPSGEMGVAHFLPHFTSLALRAALARTAEGKRGSRVPGWAGK